MNQFDNICEVQSDKASVTITSRYDGIIKTLHYQIDDVALVGSALLDFELEDDEGEIVKSAEKDQETDNSKTGERKIEEVKSEDSEVNLENIFGKVLATPAVRRIAKENNISLKDVIATGKGGRVLKEDILLHLEKMSPSSGVKAEVQFENVTGKTVVLKGYAKHMWKTMTKSLVSL